MPITVVCTSSMKEVREMKVTWDKITGYDQRLKEEQHIEVLGDINLDEDYILNPEGIRVRLDVIILAEELISEPAPESEFEVPDEAEPSASDEEEPVLPEEAPEPFEQWVTINVNGNRTYLVGIVADADVFEPGSTFYVHLMNKDDILEHEGNLDPNIMVEHAIYFFIGVIAPGGTEYKVLKKKVKIFFENIEGFDPGDLAVMNIRPEEDIEREFFAREMVDGHTKTISLYLKMKLPPPPHTSPTGQRARGVRPGS